jgi:hypothetical protein
MQRKTCLVLFLAHILSLPALVQAQTQTLGLGYYEDAFRYSRLTSVSGSARIQAVGGAQTAIGGDISNITGNPAGLGFFGKSMFSIGIGGGNAGTQTNYFTQQENKNAMTSNSKGLTNLNHLAGVITLKPQDEDSEGSGTWRGGSFGLSITRTNNFQGMTGFKGINSRNSITDSYCNQAWNIPESQFQNPIDFNTGRVAYLRPVYQSLLILADQGKYLSPMRTTTEQLVGNITQEGALETRGGQYQWNFAFGGNIADKFYFGFSAGMTTINYKQYTTFKESTDVPTTIIKNATSFDSLQVKGTGINFTLGIVARPINLLRIGLSFTAPTSFSIQETYGTTLVNNTSLRTGSFTEERASAPAGSYTYNVRTPMRANAGVAVFIKKHGFLTAEVEYVGYNNMNLRDYDDATLFTDDNATIRNVYKGVLNYKGGAEFRYEKFYLRGGYAYQPNPVQNLDALDRSLQQITGGFGFAFENNNIDISFVNTRFKSAYQPYSTNFDANGYGGYLSSKGVSPENVGDSPYSTTKHSIVQGVLAYTRKF